MTTRRILFAFLACSLLALGFVSASFTPDDAFPRAASAISKAQQQFHGIFNSEELAAHQKHLANTIQPGIDQEPKIAPDASRKQEGDASKSVVELAKRQNAPAGNETSSTSGTTTTTTTTATTSSSSVSLPTTSSTDSTTSSSSTLTTPSTTPSSISSTPATTPSSTSVTTTSQSSSASSTPSSTVPPSTSKGSPPPTESSESPSPTTSSGSTQSSVTSSSNSLLDLSSSITSPPTSVRSVTSVDVFTSTQDGGAVVTVTILTVVPAPVQEQTNAGSSPTGSPALVPDAANVNGPTMKVLLCALGMVVLAAL